MRLYLLRHARAESGKAGAPDHARALSAEGRRDAAAVGVWLARRDEPPARVLCSSATRAVETLRALLPPLPVSPVWRLSDEVYLASAWKLFEAVRATDPGVARLLVVGHNPGLADLAAKLAASGEPQALRGLARGFPPAAVAEIELPGGSWSEIELESGRLVAHFVV